MIALPATPAPKTATPRPVVFGGVQEGALGGPSVTISRMGDRHAIDVELPNLKADDRRIWTSRLLRAMAQGARMRFPQPGFNVGDPGPAVVDGGNRTGSLLPIRNLRPGYVVREGQFFTVSVRGLFYLHHATADVAVGSDGRASIPIWPMLRVVVADGSNVLFEPEIEGDLSNFGGWTLMAMRTKGPTFTITERG